MGLVILYLLYKILLYLALPHTHCPSLQAPSAWQFMVAGAKPPPTSRCWLKNTNI